MKIYVICDLEGTAGVVDHKLSCWFDGPYYPQARRLATLELNALVEGALQGGASEIVAWDGHGNFPGGLDVELLHPACKLVMGAGDAGPVGLDKSFDGMLMCGLHGMVGAEQGVLAHSFFGNVAGVWVNGNPWGEIAMNCQTAGEAGVPTIFLAGDRAAAQEVRALAPGIETAIVKEGMTSRSGGVFGQTPTLSLAPEKARQVIREGACRAMGLIGQIQPYYVAPPYTVRTAFLERKQADRAATRPGVRRIDPVTVEIENSPVIDLLF